jgi:hypothetical protein
VNNAFAAAMAGAGVAPSQPTQQPGGGSALDTVHTGTMRAGARVVISGVEKVGKTTLACGAPRTLLIPLEMGFGAMAVAKTKLIESFDELMSTLEDVKARAQAHNFPFQSLAFDSATAIEQLIHDAVIRSDPAYLQKNAKGVTMESALGGYGKAYNFANELFGRFLTICDELAFYGGINIIVTCHVFAAKVIDPAHGEYDTWDLLLHSPKNQKNYGKREMITQWADVVGFLHEPLFITKGETLNQASSLNKGRVLAVDRTPGYVAGNRYNMTGIIPIPRENGWNAVAHSIHAASGIDIFNRDV